ncbi:MAG: tyrosine-type recombinase/integrase, partial [Plesiomonas shigelloides]
MLNIMPVAVSHPPALDITNSGIDFAALTPSDLAELMRIARIRGIDVNSASEVQETMRRFLVEFLATSGRYSQRTMTQLACSWGKFARWCDDNLLASMPAKTETVTRYLSHRAVTVHRNTVTSDRWAIGRMHRAAGCPDPSREQRVGDTVSAIIREKVEAEEQIEQASPMREIYLDQLLAAWRGSPVAKERRDLALLTCAYETLLRASELSRIKMRHLAIQADGSAVLTVPITKTNHSGEPDKIALSRQAVSLIMEYFAISGRTYDGKSDAALFCALTKYGAARTSGDHITVK